MSTLKNLVDVILVFFLNNHICIIYGWKICIPSFKEKPTNCLSSGSSKFNVGYACVLAFNRPSGETFTAEKQSASPGAERLAASCETDRGHTQSRTKYRAPIKHRDRASYVTSILQISVVSFSL